MNLGDWASIAAAVVALFAAGIAIVQADSARASVKIAKQQAKAARDQVEAARDQADAALRQLDEAKRANALAEQVIAADEAERRRIRREAAVVWAVEEPSRSACRMVNVGAKTATNVVVTYSFEEAVALTAKARTGGVDATDVAPGESITVSLDHVVWATDIRTLYVVSDGGDNPCAVRIPW